MSVATARDLTPSALLRAAQRGNRVAQSVLFERHRNGVARVVLRMTGDASSVDDLVQEVFIAAFAALPRIRDGARIKSWLYTIAANKTRTWWTREKCRRKRELKAKLHELRPAEPLDDALSRTRHRARLYAALGQLPHVFREAFTIRVIEGMSLREASSVLGVGVSTLSFRTLRAQDLLCDALGIDRSARRRADQ